MAAFAMFLVGPFIVLATLFLVNWLFERRR